MSFAPVTTSLRFRAPCHAPLGSFRRKRLPSLSSLEVETTAVPWLVDSSSFTPGPAGRMDRKEFNNARRSASAATEASGSPRENPAHVTGSVTQTGIAPSLHQATHSGGTHHPEERNSALTLKGNAVKSEPTVVHRYALGNIGIM